jgi:hypothetical protein
MGKGWFPVATHTERQLAGAYGGHKSWANTTDRTAQSI